MTGLWSFKLACQVYRRIEAVFSALVRKLSIAKVKAHTMDQYMPKLTGKIFAHNFSVRLKKA